MHRRFREPASGVWGLELGKRSCLLREAGRPVSRIGKPASGSGILFGECAARAGTEDEVPFENSAVRPPAGGF